ncbi:hypothetical protein Pcinc_030582 [Petrolisthes cinctipes]|uniref:Uncharacterized protein n=1 Tax=Petrolisthes cinctipes TaxID=88211 RepID=A0AAE1EYI5_PETCI|nr:hypothetical protein Pcinc_030582 [Petrolisthes cinctipes]
MSSSCSFHLIPLDLSLYSTSMPSSSHFIPLYFPLFSSNPTPTPSLQLHPLHLLLYYTSLKLPLHAYHPYSTPLSISIPTPALSTSHSFPSASPSLSVAQISWEVSGGYTKDYRS